MADLAGDNSSKVESALSDLSFWLGSIQLHADGAPILLVGTHKDTVASEALHIKIHELLQLRLRVHKIKQLVPFEQ